MPPAAGNSIAVGPQKHEAPESHAVSGWGIVVGALYRKGLPPCFKEFERLGGLGPLGPVGLGWGIQMYSSQGYDRRGTTRHHMFVYRINQVWGGSGRAGLVATFGPHTIGGSIRATMSPSRCHNPTTLMWTGYSLQDWWRLPLQPIDRLQQAIVLCDHTITSFR